MMDTRNTTVQSVTVTETSNNVSNNSVPSGAFPTVTLSSTLPHTLLLWSLPIIIAFGTIGNIFSFIVMLRREMRQTSTFFYLATLAVADTIVLFVSAFKTWIRLCTGYEMLHISDASCKILMFLIYFSLHFSAWLIVAVTVERFIVVWFPLKATSICSIARAKLTTLGIGIILFLLNVHLFWTANLVSWRGMRQCAMEGHNELLYRHVIPWLHLSLYSFLPFVSLLIFNILIIVSLIRHRQVISNTMTKDDKRTRYIHRKLAITLLCISFVWILTTTPSALYTVLPLRPRQPQDRIMLMLIKSICYIFLYINHSINFFLYCITGQNFRREFVKVVCQLCRRKKKRPAKLTFRASHSGSGQGTSLPLVDSNGTNKGNLAVPEIVIYIKASDENSTVTDVAKFRITF